MIDSEGDSYMKLDGGSLKVPRKAFSLSSPVFLAMFGAISRFKEATNMTLDHDGVQSVSFEDDNFVAMTIVVRIIHLRSDQVSSRLEFEQLYQLAMICDKYDLKRCFGPGINVWRSIP